MRIGIDATVLQGDHRKRGIGSTAINFLNNIPDEARNNVEFVFYFYKDQTDPLELIETESLNYETRPAYPVKRVVLRAPGKLQKIGKIARVMRIFSKSINALRFRKDLFFSDSRIKDVKDLDYFIQFDQSQPLPRGTSSIVIAYDLIPYVVESCYLMKWRTARTSGLSKKAALKLQLKRWSYYSKIKRITKKATLLFAISEHTKHDFIKHLNVPEDKIKVWPLGVDEKKMIKLPKDPKLEAFEKTSWGYLPKPTYLAGKDFLLFVGGADPRRKLAELLAAFNNLRAQGREIKLVFTGDTMFGAESVPNKEFQEYVKNSSYLSDVYFFGFVTNEQREWLYKNATAFVYPSVYEGFGLPVLEAMQYGTPVITYNNSSLTEVAGDAALFASDFKTIASQVTRLIDTPSLRKEYQKRGRKQAEKYSWTKTAKHFFQLLP